MDILNFKPGCRCYFMDLGLASYYMARVGAAQTEIAGMLSENFVYINLKKRQDFPEEIAFEMPAFATFKGGEVDFCGTRSEVLPEICNRSENWKTHWKYGKKSIGIGKS